MALISRYTRYSFKGKTAWTKQPIKSTQMKPVPVSCITLKNCCSLIKKKINK